MSNNLGLKSVLLTLPIYIPEIELRTALSTTGHYGVTHESNCLDIRTCAIIYTTITGNIEVEVLHYEKVSDDRLVGYDGSPPDCWMQ